MNLNFGSVTNCFVGVKSRTLVIGIFALVIISFYAGSLFGERRLVYTQEGSGTTETIHSSLPNRVFASTRSPSIQISETGMNVCPLQYAEHIPCHDKSFTKRLLKNLNLQRKENLERHCPPLEKRLFCLVPPPEGYKLPIRWPRSRDYVWKSNVNHSKLAQVKGGQNWVHDNGTKWWFPGGGTHFKHGAPEYIDRLGKMITNGQGSLQTAGVVQVLDVGCGVGSFAAFLLPLGINTMSFAPRDEHENQVQFALERGISAMLSILATTRLPYPSKSFELVHCSRCRVDWHDYDGILLKEVDRVLRPKGYFAYSAPPVYRSDKSFPQEWNMIMKFAASLCWEFVGHEVQTAIWQKTSNRSCQLEHAQGGALILCNEKDDPDKSWKKQMQNCIYLSSEAKEINLLPRWPDRLRTAPQRLVGGGGSAAQFEADTVFWQGQVKFYWSILKVSESSFRNVMDMNAFYGGFAAAAVGKPLSVMNVVPPGRKNTLPVIYDRGLIGTFHDWCEPFSTYPRTYDLLHSFRVLSAKKKGCQMEDIMLEMDRMLRPLGFIIIRDSSAVVQAAASLAPKFLWNATVHNIYVDGEQHPKEQLLVCRKSFWTIT